MEKLELMNVIGSEETMTLLNKKEIQAEIQKMQFPVGEKIPSSWQPPQGYFFEKMEIEGVDVEHIMPQGGENGHVILNFHGGGYVWALMDSCRDVTIRYSECAKGVEVYNVDYKVAPTHLYPVALEECLRVYKWLIKRGYKGENILLTGESAGGGLVLAVTLYLKDHHMPLPKGVIAISPWADMVSTSVSRRVNNEKDLMLGEGGCQINGQIADSDYAKGGDIRDPYLSPVYGDYKEFPNLLIQVGTYEILYDDAVAVAKKAQDAGVNVTLSSYCGMSHCFQELFYDIPETKAAWQEINQFIKNNLGVKA